MEDITQEFRESAALKVHVAETQVIDDDLGRAGTSAEGRQGFQRLVAEVGSPGWRRCLLRA
jgi:hypothetical protein